MRRIIRSFKNFLFRLKNKRTKKYEEFAISLIITYILTCFFAFCVLLDNFSNIMYEIDFHGSVWSFISTTKLKFTFGNCENLDVFMYIYAKFFETLVPTTITFATAIFATQVTKVRKTLLTTGLCVSILCYTIVGVLFMCEKLISMLGTYMWILMVLFVCVFIFSAKTYTLTSRDSDAHKSEIHDGQICG